VGVAEERFANERADFNPRSWLSKYRRTSIGYLVKMLIFYHGVGVGLLLAGTAILEVLIPDYEEPSVPRSLLTVLVAGPIEETLFFGLPFYVFGNAYSVLLTGSIWAVLHIFNTPTFELTSLAFGNWLFVVPSLFFSLRTWVSGKGWFSVLVHSAWNGVFFGAGCATEEMTCSVADENMFLNLGVIALSAGLLAGTYILYRVKEKRKRFLV
jgi:hypothetical protein